MKREFDRIIVLRIRPFREHDALVTVFGENFGKKTILVAGLKKGNSSKSGLFLPFSILNAEFSKSKNIARLFEAELFSAPPPLETELFALIEMSEKISSEGQSSPEFFDLLCSLSAVQHWERILPLFLVKTLTIFGLLSDFRFCAQSQSKFQTDGFFEKGALFSEQHRKAGEKILFSEIKILSFWQKNPVNIAEKVIFSEEFGKKVIRIFSDFLEKEGVCLHSWKEAHCLRRE